MELLILSALFGIIGGSINYAVLYKKGYTAKSGWILGVFAFTSIAYLFLKYFYQ
jgi:hypothetical protein